MKEPFYDNFLFVPMRQKAVSTLTEPTLKEWGIDIKEKTSILLNPCCKDEHGQHEHMLHFYKNNRDLLSYYTHVMARSDAAQKKAVRADFDFLKGVKADPIPVCHTDTKFHCLGHPF